MKSLAAALPALRLFEWVMAWAAARGTANRKDDEPKSMEEDFRCMALVAAGDPDALQPLFDRWKLPLLSYFYRALGSRADAEDLTLTTFERVFRAAKRFKPEARFSTWLFSIARRELLHELRRRRRKPVEAVPPEELALFNADSSSSERQRAAELEEHLLNVLQELPERQRTALILTAAGDLSPAEVADSLKVSPNNLNVILHRARQALRTLFNRES